MKFKVGDKVRPTREHLINAIENNIASHLEYIDGFQVLEIKDDRVFYYINEKNAFYKAEHLEIVPEKPEFEYGEEVEVWNYSEYEWKKAVFISKIPGNVGCSFACLAPQYNEKFNRGEEFEIELWRKVRKLRPQLTRKEIAEKLGISEDFTLVD